MDTRQRELAWERNIAWVRRRYPELGDKELEELREFGMVPRASGELIAGPEVVLNLLAEIKSLHGRILALSRKRKGDVDLATS